VKTDNVRHLSLRPPATLSASSSVQIDDTLIDELDLTEGIGLRREPDGEWVLADLEPPPGEKRPGLSGPFGDLFGAGTVLVAGTAGSAEETFFQDWCARDASFFVKQWNGGVHRGGIPGESWVELPVVTDAEHERSSSAANVVAYGTPSTNRVLAAVADRLQLRVDPGKVRVGDRVYEGEDLGLIAVVAFPDGSSRYLGMHSGSSADATTSGAHLNWQLLPDYLVYDAERVLEWGFFDNDWQPVAAGTSGGEEVE
jgi:hypothetical protein